MMQTESTKLAGRPQAAFVRPGLLTFLKKLLAADRESAFPPDITVLSIRQNRAGNNVIHSLVLAIPPG